MHTCSVGRDIGTNFRLTPGGLLMSCPGQANDILI